MGVTVWLALVIATIVAWSATSLLYNVGIVMYAYAMAIDSVSTDPIVAIYPILVMLGGRVLMGERLSAAQYALLLGIVSGSILIVAGTI